MRKFNLSKLTFYIVRHGETVWNTENRFQGHLNSPLTDTGLEQAKVVGEKLVTVLGRKPSIAFFSSPIGRARQTADIIAEHLGIDTAEIVRSDLLKEYDFGEWSGLTSDEIIKQYPGEFEKREANKWDFSCPGGESYAVLAGRVDKFFSSLPESGIVLSVAHGMINRVIRGKLLQLPEAEILQGLQHHDQILRIDDSNGEEWLRAERSQ